MRKENRMTIDNVAVAHAAALYENYFPKYTIREEGREVVLSLIKEDMTKCFDSSTEPKEVVKAYKRMNHVLMLPENIIRILPEVEEEIHDVRMNKGYAGIGSGVSKRINHVLMKHGIDSYADLYAWLKICPNALLNIKGLGKKSWFELLRYYA